MDIPVTYDEAKSFVSAMALTQPRVLAMFIALPLFNNQLIPGLLRWAVAGAVGLIMVPVIQNQSLHESLQINAVLLMLYILKEAFVGFVLGLLAALPFWIFEAVGFLVDNQRGASISATLNPITGNDSSPLGILFNQAFIVFFLISGGMGLLLGTLYDSFAIWPPLEWTPQLDARHVPLLLARLDDLVRMAVLLAAPALVVMFLAEFGLALISRFAPQLQVFFMAMPIKSALAMLVLMLYASTLFEYAQEHVQGVRQIFPWLQDLWGVHDTSARGTP